jgi:hypothetical protein
MLITIEGIYRNGRVELVEAPGEIQEETRVIVTFLPKAEIDLQARGISPAEATELRASFLAFAEEWESPEMEIYDDYDRAKVDLSAR